MSPARGTHAGNLWPLHWKLLGAFALVGLATPLVAAVVGQTLLARAIVADARARLDRSVASAAAGLSAPDFWPYLLPPGNAAYRKLAQSLLTTASAGSGAAIIVVSASGHVVFGRPAWAAALQPVFQRVMAGQAPPSYAFNMRGVPTVVAGLPICGDGLPATVSRPVCQDGAPVGAVLAFRQVDQLRESSRYEQQVVRWSWIAGIGLSLALSLALAGGMTRPLRAMALAAEAISQGDFGHRVPPGPRDEVGLLAEAFNSMAERLDRLLAARRALLAAVSHELRTPLTSIQGFVTALREQMIPAAEVERTYGIIQEEIARLRRLIDDLFELSKLEAGQTTLRFQPVPVAELVQAAAERGRILAGTDGAHIGVEVGAGAGTAVLDPDRVVQVLGNLVQNAIRFTPATGRIILRVHDAEAAVRFEVEDTGAGIAAADQAHVFERFYTAEPSRSRPGAGTGIGLSIAREIVRAHGGRMGVRSAPGEGSLFWFELPRARAASRDAPTS